MVNVQIRELKYALQSYYVAVARAIQRSKILWEELIVDLPPYAIAMRNAAHTRTTRRTSSNSGSLPPKRSNDIAGSPRNWSR